MEENLTLLFAHDVRNYSILNFAYMGDTVLELFTREYLLKTSGKTKPGELVTASRRCVTCEAQSDAVSRIEPLFSEEEADIFRRGRNAKTHFTPKHGDAIQYRRATGFEALMGYLYLTGRVLRAKELFLAAFDTQSGTNGHSGDKTDNHTKEA